MAVEEVLVGEAPDEVEVITLGGMVDGIGQHVSGAARLAVGRREALYLVRRDRFDVVLTDLGLPDMSGEAVIVAIRASDEAGTPIAVVSGDDPSSLRRAREVGAERTFHKPVNWKDLMFYLASKRPTGAADHGLPAKAIRRGRPGQGAARTRCSLHR